MEEKDTKLVSGYGKPPWVFKGRALYQFNLVKAETARALIPKDFKLVEAFGYTLGGFFLASYDDSPAGIFDELVVIAGIVWNPPTSCAWSARVLVNSDDACAHGRKEVGLPSQVAKFSKKITETPTTSQGKINGFLNMMGIDAVSHKTKKSMDIQVSEVKGYSAADICNISLCTGAGMNSNKWMGPPITMSLPSFSGLTELNPNLLKYSCKIACRVRAVQPARVSGPVALEADRGSSECQTSKFEDDLETGQNERNLSISVMLSKPIFALEFNGLRMDVDAPIIVSHTSRKTDT